MLGHNDVIATIPVSDLGRSRKFYEDKLGLVALGMIGDECVTYGAGDTRIFMYQTIAPITAHTIVATWAVDDILETLVEELSEKGITFEHFEKEGFKPQGNVYHTDSFKVALLRDPDGNMLSLFQPHG
jgi:catechol 2,3-dioxygenase-like lactoylglutathione lyase family enzyme